MAKKSSEILKRPFPENPLRRRLVLINVARVMRFALKSPGSMPSSVVNGRFVTVWFSLMHCNYINSPSKFIEISHYLILITLSVKTWPALWHEYNCTMVLHTM